jgi:TonB family protein
MTNNGPIRATAFGDATLTPPSAKKAESAADGFTPVEILFKPKPAYTVEAREMRLEGEVSLQVIFQASGTIRVVRVVQGLGHGLDEAAQQAALRVRFKPAKRGGVPVDTNATIKISFELT